MGFADQNDDARKKEEEARQAELKRQQEAREAELKRLHEETQRRKNKDN